MKNLVCLLLALSLYVFSSQCLHAAAQGQSLHQLSYGGEALPAYQPPTTSTTTTVEPPTTKSSFFGGIKNWFRKTPTEAPEVTPSTTTARSVATAAGQSTTFQQSSVTTSTTTYGQPQPATPVTQPSRSASSPAIPPSSTSAQPSSPTSGGRRDYVNPNLPSSQPGLAKPSTPVVAQPQPSSPIPAPTQPSGGRRDYVDPKLSTSRPASPKEDFPALPSPRRPSHEEYPALPPSRQVTPTPSTLGTTGQSAWNTRPAQSTPSTGGSTAQSAWPRPTEPTSSTSGVRFVPTTPRPGNARPATQSQQGQTSPQLATDDEITTLTETLISKDVNNLNKYMTVDFQGKTRSYESKDDAPNPLLQIDAKAFDVPTVATMKLLFNNYELDTSINEYVTPIEKREENDFIDAVMATSVMRQAMLFLQSKGIVTPDPKTHRELLKTIWFSLYSRGGGKIGSSGFEHIFMSEVKNGTITGLHNSLYYNEEEQKGHIDYKGYIRKVDLGNKGAIAKFRFTFNGISKPVNALFIGTSPELEMALYTICFELRPDKDCPISLNGNRLNLRTYTFRYRGKRLIGSGFPEL